MRENIRERSVRAALATGAAGFADLAIRVASTAILARIIAPDHFGLVMMTTAIISISEQLRELGLSSATVQRAEVTQAEVSNLFWINAALGALLSLCIAAAAPAVAAFYRDERLIGITACLSITVLLGSLTVQHQALLTRQLRLGHTACTRLVASVLSTALAVYLAKMGYGYWALIWREVARSAFLMAGMWCLLPWLPSLPSRHTDVRAMLRFGANLTGANLLSNLTSGFDRFLLGRLWGATPVAIYRQSFQLVSTVTDQLLSPIYQVAQPSLCLLQNDPARYQLLYSRLLTIVCILTMPLSVFIAVYADTVVESLLGHNWIEAAPLLTLLSFSAFVKQAIGSSALILIMRGSSATYLGLSTVQNAVSVSAYCVGAPWGATGIAMAELVSTYALIGPRLHYSLHDSGISVGTFVRAIARPALSAIAMGYALLGWRLLPSMLGIRDSLMVGATIAVIAFSGAWALLPIGNTDLPSLITEVRTAIRNKNRRPRISEATAPAN